MRLSVVIPTFNRDDRIRRALEGLGRQTLPAERFEVLVVDDGSPRPPDPVVREFAARYHVRVLRKPNGGIGSARNLGAGHAMGEIVVFLDDDILPCPEFLAEHLAVHERDARAVGLGSLPHPDDLPLTPFLFYLDRIRHYDLFLRYASADRIPLPPLNGNSSVRRVHFELAGGYDPAFAGYGGEDTELGYRLVKSGLRFVYANGARGAHYHLKGYEDYKRDMFASGVTMVRIVRRHPEVRSRVNLDLVAGPTRDLTLEKRAKRAAFLTLERFPILVRVLEGAIAHLEPRGWNRVLYPFYLTASHYRYGLGMREELARGGE